MAAIINAATNPARFVRSESCIYILHQDKINLIILLQGNNDDQNTRKDLNILVLHIQLLTVFTKIIKSFCSSEDPNRTIKHSLQTLQHAYFSLTILLHLLKTTELHFVLFFR